jgi:MoxR-like ATPase
MPKDWKVFRGTGSAPKLPPKLPPAPGWRQFNGTGADDLPPPPSENTTRRLGKQPVAFPPDSEEVRMVNAAIYLRRALLITGKPGVGKSTLAHFVARELGLGAVLGWPITTRSTLQDGLYSYDAVGRLHAARLSQQDGPTQRDDQGYSEIGRYVQLGPLGTALLPANRPRVILIDEIDKSDLDFPNDLLNVLEEGEFTIPELARYEGGPAIRVRTADKDRQAIVHAGRVACREFPLVFMTSNGEKDFPPAFLRRCLRLEMAPPDEARLTDMVASHIAGELNAEKVRMLVRNYFTAGGSEDRAADQLLNAVFIIAKNSVSKADEEFLEAQLLKPLDAS